MLEHSISIFVIYPFKHPTNLKGFSYLPNICGKPSFEFLRAAEYATYKYLEHVLERKMWETSFFGNYAKWLETPWGYHGVFHAFLDKRWIDPFLFYLTWEKVTIKRHTWRKIKEQKNLFLLPLFFKAFHLEMSDKTQYIICLHHITH